MTSPKGSSANLSPANNSHVFNRGDSFFGIQAKLNIGKQNDKYEKEADSVADKVVAFSQKKSSNDFFAAKPELQRKGDEESIQKESDEIQEKPLADSISPVTQLSASDDESIQEQCEACGEGKGDEQQVKEDASQDIQKLSFKSAPEEIPDPIKVQKKCSSCQEEGAESVQMKEKEASSGLESNLNLSRGGGDPMSKDVKAEMESGFGADFSGVRLHTNSTAIQMSQDIGAQAFTNGNDIYFNQGKYEPNSSKGKHLLAHELTHTIQQNKKSSPAPIQRATKINDVNIHTDSKAKELTDERQADAVTIKNDIYIAPDQLDATGGVDSGLLNHEMTHVEQQKRYSADDIGNVDTYMALEQQAISSESAPEIQKAEDSSVSDLAATTTTDETVESQRLAYFESIALRKLGVFQAIRYQMMDNKTLQKYENFMKESALSDAAYIKSKLLENWVDDSDEGYVISTLRTWGGLPSPKGTNYLDLILDYLKSKSLYMDYFISESTSVTFLDQLYEEMEGGNKKRLYSIIDGYSSKYSGYRGRNGVSAFGSFGNSMIDQRVKKKISTLNRKMSGMKTVSMTDSEIRRSNQLYTKIRSQTFGLVDLPSIQIKAAEGQNAAQAIAIPVITVGMILTALLIALLVVLALILIMELLIILERAIDRVKARDRDKTKRKPCNVYPLGYHRGGHPRHNRCADIIPPNIYPGSDIEVVNPNLGVRKSFDALDATRGLWEVKTHRYTYYSSQSLKDLVIASHLAEMAIELPLATSCGYMYYFGVTDINHFRALAAVAPPGVNLRLMSC
ncbi:MAG: DUF4157 domain-containing protein [Flavobacteriales bacterium]|nr:DUF4157 domain-containing protein [Flavobacteriales bacterium]